MPSGKSGLCPVKNNFLIATEKLQDEIEPIGMSGEAYLKATADSMISYRHPIYDCKFWIYEEQRLAPYEEYRDFYRRLADGSDKDD